jgi:SAM-dependent methyltransferase
MNAPIDFAALKTRQQAAWSTGDYSVIGTTLQIVGESLAEACDLKTDERVLDVAAGNGNATLAAARRGCLVTRPTMSAACSSARAERARAERLEVTFQTADAKSLPFPTRASMPPCRPSASCSRPTTVSQPTKWPASCARAVASAWRAGRPTASSAACSRCWAATCRRRRACRHRRYGAPRRICAACSAPAAAVQARPLHFAFRYRSAAHFIDVFRTWYGPVNKAFAAQSPEKAEALAGELADLLNSLNRAGPGSLVVPSEYLEVVVTRA